MKKILFIVPRLSNGGAEKVLVNLLNNLDREKYDITLLSLFGKGVNEKFLKNDIKFSSVFKNVFRGNIHFLKLLSPGFLFKYLIKDEYDIIVSFLQGPTTRIASGSTNPNTKLISWIHTAIDNEKLFLTTYRNRKELIKTYNSFDLHVCVSEMAKSKFLDLFNEIEAPLVVKYNPIDSVMIKNMSNEDTGKIIFDNRKINLVTVGEFKQVKGYERLIEVVNKLVKEQYVNFHLYFVGDGDLRTNYENLILKYNLTNYITFLGYQDNPYKFLKKSDLYVCSSYREGFSTAVAESIIVGTPVITTDVSGMRELLGLKNEFGVITKNTTEDLYTGIKEFLDNKQKLDFYKDTIKQRSSMFELSKSINEIEKILDEI